MTDLTIWSAPVGTIAPSRIGGQWTKTDTGWQANGGDTFPAPGADWTGQLIPPAIETVSRTYFGCTVTAMKKGWPSCPWMFKIERNGHSWEFTGVPNYCSSVRSALRRGWWRAKWIAEGTYDQHYQ